MLKLLTTDIEVTSKTVCYAVDVQFEKDGEFHEANVTCILYDDENTGFPSWETTLANEDELPGLTQEEITEIKEHAQKYADKLAD
jgi:hypothetical protein